MICEVCHKPFDPEAFERMREEYEGDIYRPGEPVDFSLLSEHEKSERRHEIEEAFGKNGKVSDE